MGNVLVTPAAAGAAALATTVIGATGLAVAAIPMAVIATAVVAVRVASQLLSPPDKENPTLAGIRARHKAEGALRRAEEATKAARQLAEQIQRKGDQEREEARVRQQEADRAVSRAIEEVQRMKAQMKEAACAARRAQELSEATANAARGEAEKFAQEVQEERERSQRTYRDMEKAVAVAKEEAVRVRQAADEQRRETEVGKVLAEERARAAAEQVRKAIEAKEEAEKRLKEGIQPVVTPSPEEVAATKRRIEYSESYFHFAIAGISGSGKSSLVNAFLGLRGRDPGAAAVGVTETTLQVTRYPSANPEYPFVLYDIPGAGTLKCPDWQYFNEQGLYVFDCLIVLFDTRFTQTDIAILTNARRFNVPTYIVRSKADQHIRNTMIEMGYDSDEDDEDAERRNRLRRAARNQFVTQTRESVRVNLEDANLPDQRVYIVSNTPLLTLVRNRMPREIIDEVELLSDILHQAHATRVTQPGEVGENRDVVETDNM